MNAAQRRKAYRKLPKVGSKVIFKGRECAVISRCSNQAEGSKDSVARVRLDMGNGWTAAPRLFKVQIVK